MDKTTKRIPIEVEPLLHQETHVKSVKSQIKVSEIIRAFLRAWVKNDRRAQQIVQEYSDDKQK